MTTLTSNHSTDAQRLARELNWQSLKLKGAINHLTGLTNNLNTPTATQREILAYLDIIERELSAAISAARQTNKETSA